MVSLRSFLTTLGPFQLSFFLLVQDLRMCSFQTVDFGCLNISSEPQELQPTFLQITAGRSVTLNCTVTQLDLPANVRWYKSLSNGRKLIYKEGDQFSRGVRLVPRSTTDFSIRLSKLGPKDNGTYQCLTSNKVFQLGESVIQKQVVVYVTAPPTVRLETDPPSPVQLNTTVTVVCNAEHFYPNVAKLDLFCKNPNSKGKIALATLNANGTYSRQSSLKIMATENWNASLFTCLVKYNSAVLKATARLFITTEGSLQQSMMGLYLGLFLNKLGLVFFFMGLFKIKARGCCIVRHFASSSQG